MILRTTHAVATDKTTWATKTTWTTKVAWAIGSCIRFSVVNNSDVKGLQIVGITVCGSRSPDFEFGSCSSATCLDLDDLLEGLTFSEAILPLVFDFKNVHAHSSYRLSRDVPIVLATRLVSQDKFDLLTRPEFEACLCACQLLEPLFGQYDGSEINCSEGARSQREDNFCQHL